jgi:hypothetical protein
LPTFFVTVNPSLTGASSPRSIACTTTPGSAAFRPFPATRKNSARRFSRPILSFAMADRVGCFKKWPGESDGVCL